MSVFFCGLGAVILQINTLTAESRQAAGQSTELRDTLAEQSSSGGCVTRRGAAEDWETG